MKPYHELTELGRARRLRAVVAVALEEYDLDVRRVRLLTNETNGIFRIDTGDGAKHVVRVGLGGEIAHTAGAVGAEVEWLTALAAETPLRVPVPMAARSGERFVTAKAPGVPEPRNVVVFSWLPGRLLDERISAEAIREYGAVAAALHVHGADHQPTDPRALARYDRVHPFDEPVVLFKADRELMPESRLEVFVTARGRVEDAVDNLRRSGEPMRVLHGDLHVWNVMVSRYGLAPFDFEDVMWGWPIQDIATSLYYLQDRPNFAELLADFRGGYETVADWPERYPGELDVFLIGRFLVLANDLLITPEWRGLASRLLERYERRLRTLLK